MPDTADKRHRLPQDARLCSFFCAHCQFGKVIWRAEGCVVFIWTQRKLLVAFSTQTWASRLHVKLGHCCSLLCFIIQNYFQDLKKASVCVFKISTGCAHNSNVFGVCCGLLQGRGLTQRVGHRLRLWALKIKSQLSLPGGNLHHKIHEDLNIKTNKNKLKSRNSPKSLSFDSLQAFWKKKNKERKREREPSRSWWQSF